VAWILGGLVALVTFVATDDLAGANAFLPPACGGVGVAALGYNRFRLTRWARVCEAQMRRVVDRAQEFLSVIRTLPARAMIKPAILIAGRRARKFAASSRRHVHRNTKMIRDLVASTGCIADAAVSAFRHIGRNCRISLLLMSHTR